MTHDNPTQDQDDELAYVTRVQERYTEMLLEKPNVIGVGVGLQEQTESGDPTEGTASSGRTLSPRNAQQGFFPPAGPASDAGATQGPPISRYCLVVMVTEPIDPQSLPAEARIPDQLEGVPVEVRPIGMPRAQ